MTRLVESQTLSESRMRENRPSGSMSGTWNGGMIELVRHRQTKEPETDRPDLNHHTTFRLYRGAAPGYKLPF